MKYFQVIRTDHKGNISGVTSPDPISLIAVFTSDGKAEQLYSEVIFKVLGESALTRFDPKLTFAKITGKGEALDILFTEAEKSELLKECEKEYKAKLYNFIAIFNLRTGRVEKLFEAEQT